MPFFEKKVGVQAGSLSPPLQHQMFSSISPSCPTKKEDSKGIQESSSEEEGKGRIKEGEDMEEEIVMMTIRSNSSGSSCSDNKISSPTPSHDQPTSWKLYRNPFYNSHTRGNNTRFPHRQPDRPLPSARKIAASFWDLAFFRPSALSMDRPGCNENMELRAELERERRARRKLEYVNKKLAKELAEERQGREAVERACEELVREISCDRACIDRMRQEIEEERKMLRMAEMMREERVQMKLAEAKVFLEEKMSKLEVDAKQDEEAKRVIVRTLSTALKPTKRLVLGEKQSNNDLIPVNGGRGKAAGASHRRLSPSPEPENPHIKRGIKGFVEFPRIVRAMGSKGRSWGARKVECQKAQIRILLKQRSPIRSTNHTSLIWGS